MTPHALYSISVKWMGFDTKVSGISRTPVRRQIQWIHNSGNRDYIGNLFSTHFRAFQSTSKSYYPLVKNYVDTLRCHYQDGYNNRFWNRQPSSWCMSVVEADWSSLALLSVGIEVRSSFVCSKPTKVLSSVVGTTLSIRFPIGKLAK